MVVRISDKTQNYSKVTKLLVKPKYYDKNNLFPILKSNIDNGYAYVVTWEDFLKYASADISIAFEHKDSTPSYKIIKSL